jgi:hypothetical protein
MLTTLLLQSPVSHGNRHNWLTPSVYGPLQHGRPSGFVSVVSADLTGSAMGTAAHVNEPQSSSFRVLLCNTPRPRNIRITSPSTLRMVVIYWRSSAST